jgi:hypothetical protein
VISDGKSLQCATPLPLPVESQQPSLLDPNAFFSVRTDLLLYIGAAMVTGEAQ